MALKVHKSTIRKFLQNQTSGIKMGKRLSMDDKQLIIQLHIRGFSNRLISQQLQCCVKTVFTVIKNWSSGKIVDRKKSTKWRLKLSAQKSFLVLKYFIKHPFNTYMQRFEIMRVSLYDKKGIEWKRYQELHSLFQTVFVNEESNKATSILIEI